MVKIDLHIHTIQNKHLDCSFSYNSLAMKEYVVSNSIDAIAITNHNLFDKTNYLKIKSDLSHTNCLVFPGIEISLEGGHILAIGDGSNESISAFEQITKHISVLENDDQYFMPINEFNSLVCGNGFLLIPHIKKKPYINDSVIKQINDPIVCGEVQSRKQFINMIDEEKICPVLFSDIRIGLSENLDDYKNNNRFIFLDSEEISFSSIFSALSNKQFVSLTEHGGHKLFDVLDSKVTASSGINVLIGKRSSGKTYLLNSIYNTEPSTSLYIKQFQISNESEKIQFNKNVKNEHLNLVINFFKEFLSVLNYVDSCKLSLNNAELGRYVESLKDYSMLGLNDIYSKTPLFNYQDVELEPEQEVINLVDGMDNMLSVSEKYRPIIEKEIDREVLIKLYKYFVEKLKTIRLTNKIINECNDVAKTIGTSLALKSTATPIEDVSFLLLLKQIYVRKKFNALVNNFSEFCVGDETILEEFNKTVIVSKNKNKTTLKSILGVPRGATIDYLLDLEPIEAYLTAIDDTNIINAKDNLRFRLFFDYQIKIVDKFGSDISGGQTAEYVLLNKLTHYHSYDFVLIDEMESSFDNPFLNEKIVKTIQDISETCTVFISTHNNNLGVSLQPDYYIYHKKVKDGDDVEYRRFCGKPTEMYLKDYNLNQVKLSDILIETMEASPEAYKERNKKYEGSKN